MINIEINLEDVCLDPLIVRKHVYNCNRLIKACRCENIYSNCIGREYRCGTTRTGDLKCREVKTGFTESDICKPFLWDSNWLEIWKSHLCPSMGPNEGSVVMSSGWEGAEGWKVSSLLLLLHKHKKFFEECFREKTAYLATFKSKSMWVDNIFIETAEIETGMAEKSSWDQANRRQKPGLVWRNRKKISQIIKDYFYLPFFLLIILWV